MTRDEFIAAARAVQPKEYDYSRLEPAFTTSVKVPVCCPEHGLFYQRIDAHLDGRVGCVECRRAITSAKRTAPFIAKATAYHNDKYDYSKVQYVDLDTPVEIVCPTHGSFMQTPRNHLRGGCQKCAPNVAVDFDEFVKRSRAVHGDQYVYHHETYKGVATKTRITCPVHGDFEQAPYKHYGGQGCGKCYVHRAAYSFLDDAAAVHGTKYRYLEEYKGYYVPIRIECPEHGEFTQTPSNHLLGSGCPKCAYSDGRSEIERRISDKFPLAEQGNRKVLHGQEIDLLISPSLGVEINGMFWHSERRGRGKDYHLAKTTEAAAAGVQLLQFWDREVVEHEDIICSMIRAKAGQSENLIFARYTTAAVIPSNTAYEFLKANHLQGACSATVCVGLYHMGDLVMVATFGKPRFNNDYQWELLRLCSVLNTTVVGGASKLLKHFMRNHTGSILSYANRRWSDGKVYERLGFTLVRETEPSYVWFDGVRVLSRYQCQKSKLHKLLGDKYDPAKSERENMVACGYTRVWDCGNLVYGLSND